jgi:hypothetical protein
VPDGPVLCAQRWRDGAHPGSRWANESREPATAQRLADRAKDMISFAERAEAYPDANADAFDVFNASQMIGPKENTKA